MVADADGVLARVRGDAAVVSEIISGFGLLYALIENRVRAVNVCSRGSTSRK
jgi:hypothetical protein